MSPLNVNAPYSKLFLMSDYLSKFDFCHGVRACKSGSSRQSGEDDCKVKAAIKTILRFAKVTVGIFGKFERMVPFINN